MRKGLLASAGAAALGVAALFLSPQPGDLYASPAGAGTACSQPSPCSIQTAISQATPGRKIWLTAGRYNGPVVLNANGSSASPIRIEPLPGSLATIAGPAAVNARAAVEFRGSYTHLVGAEITSNGTDRSSTQTTSWPSDINVGDGVDTANGAGTGPGNKVINCTVHGTRQGLSIWGATADFEAYGNLIYDNGWTAPDRNHGHAIYSQNATTTRRVFADNIIQGAWGYGLHVFGSTPLDYHTITGNFVYGGLDSAAIIGGSGGTSVKNPVLDGNVFRGNDGGFFMGFNSGTTDLEFRNNLFLDRKIYWRNNVRAVANGNVMQTEIDALPAGSFPVAGNAIYPCLWPWTNCPGPSTNEVRIRPNAYDPSRFHVAIASFTAATSQTVALAGEWRAFAPSNMQSPVAQGSGAVVLPVTPGGLSVYVVFVGGAPSPSPTAVAPTATQTPPPTSTLTPTQTSTLTPTATASITPTSTMPPTNTPTRTNTPTNTPTFTRTPTAPPPTRTHTPTKTPTPTDPCWQRHDHFYRHSHSDKQGLVYTTEIKHSHCSDHSHPSGITQPDAVVLPARTPTRTP